MPAGQGSEGSGFKLPYGRVRQPPPAPEPYPSPPPPEAKESFFSGIINILKRIASFVGHTERQIFYELTDKRIKYAIYNNIKRKAVRS